MRKSQKQRTIAKSSLNVKLSEFKPCNQLHIAALEGNIPLSSQLVSQQVFDIDEVGERGFTALHFAANSGALEVLTNRKKKHNN